MSFLISDSDEEILRKCDESREEMRRRIPDEETFRRTFIRDYAQQIELIRRGARVVETVADVKRRMNLPICDGDWDRPAVLELPDKKPLPTPAQARRAIWWSRITRPVRHLWALVRKAVRWTH